MIISDNSNKIYIYKFYFIGWPKNDFHVNFILYNLEPWTYRNLEELIWKFFLFFLLLLLFMTTNQSVPLCPHEHENIKMF